MTSPTTYGEWMKLFDTIEKSAQFEEYIQVIRTGKISFTSGVSERFIQSVTTMIRNRISKAQDVYKSQMKNNRSGEMGVSRALQSLAREYRFLYQLANALPIPANYRDQVAQLVKDQADFTQTSLLDTAKSDRTGKLASIVRSAAVNKL